MLNGYDTSVEPVREKVRGDLTHLHNDSLWNDVRILVRTVRVVWTGKGRPRTGVRGTRPPGRDARGGTRSGTGLARGPGGLDLEPRG